MKKKSRIIDNKGQALSGWICLLMCLGLFAARNALAVGFRLPNQDPEAIARGNAFAATADNPSAIYYNPAGITQIPGQTVGAGIYAVSSGVKYEGNGVNARTDGTPQPVPQFYYVNSLTNLPISYGLGVYVPYGLSVDWGNNTSFRTIAEKGSLLYATVNPVVAWQICPSLSIGGGPTINYSKATFERGIVPAALSTSDKFRFVGNDYAFGFNAGLRWQPLEKWSFGVKYFSATTMDYRGHSLISSPFLPPALNGTTPTKAEIKFPMTVVGGISFRPTENWNFEFDLDWTDFAIDKQITFDNTPAGPAALTLNYRSSFMYEFGVTRRLPKNYFVSVGYFFSENSSPDPGFNPIIPDSDLHLGSVGFGHKGKRVDWALAYHFGYNPGRSVSGSPTAAPFFETADGTYRVFNQGATASVALRF